MAPTWAGPGLFKCNITATLSLLESYNVYDLFQPRNLVFFCFFLRLRRLFGLGGIGNRWYKTDVSLVQPFGKTWCCLRT